MFRIAFAAALLIACGQTLNAQDDVAFGEPSAASPSDQPVAVPADISPEVWVYMQSLKRYDDPKQAVRRKAEERSARRRARLESQRWYGISPLRPSASPLPFMGSAAPSWVGNSWDPYRWVSPTTPRVVLHGARVTR
jgi:hypothetical protein